MIVLDNSAFVLLLTDAGGVGKAIAGRLDGAELAAPAVIDLEAANALRGLLRGGKIDAAVAGQAMAIIPDFPLERFPHQALLPRIWELRENFTPYDAAYIALAEQLDAPLVTSDEKLQRASGKRCAVEVIR
ncbi:type II toxin-antitoxin system VapC family toxin [Streptomyces sp. SYSU K217416]